jgi:hypothetical protein
MLCDWMKHRDMGAPSPEMLPRVGVVIDDKAMGFLVETNNKIAVIDNICSTYKYSKEERRAAVKRLIDCLIGTAGALGYKAVTVLSNLHSQDERLLSLGFKCHGNYNYFYKELGE